MKPRVMEIEALAMHLYEASPLSIPPSTGPHKKPIVVAWDNLGAEYQDRLRSHAALALEWVRGNLMEMAVLGRNEQLCLKVGTAELEEYAKYQKARGHYILVATTRKEAQWAPPVGAISVYDMKFDAATARAFESSLQPPGLPGQENKNG